jgi:hypothetical protein
MRRGTRSPVWCVAGHEPMYRHRHQAQPYRNSHAYPKSPPPQQTAAAVLQPICFDLNKFDIGSDSINTFHSEAKQTWELSDVPGMNFVAQFTDQK